MQIVTDRGMDLSPEQLTGLGIHFIPLHISLGKETFSSGVDIQPDEFYEKLAQTEEYPTTSQPSPGDFAELYRRLAETDPDILSIHISSGLSGTINAARNGAAMVPEANVIIVDTKTLSVPEGWQVEAAVKGLKAGWSLEKVLGLLDRIRAQSEGIFTLPTLRYLVHGGRINHLTALVASLLNIKPIIGVEKIGGTYITHGQEITFKRAIGKMVDIVANIYPAGTNLRVQLLHGRNLEAVDILRKKMENLLSCTFEATTPIAPVLGAHTGPGMVGMAVAPMSLFSELP